MTVPSKNANEALNKENHSFSEESMLLQGELENAIQDILIIKISSDYSQKWPDWLIFCMKEIK